VVVFMIGVNDVGRATIRMQDRALTDDSALSPLVRAARHSALLSLLLNVRRSMEARQALLPYREVDLRAQPAFLPGRKHRQDLLQGHAPHLAAYRQRVSELVRLCRAAGMEPVLVTQPVLYGPAVDDVTGVDLGRIEVDREHLINGRAGWELLERYNDVVRGLGASEDVLVVDVARTMPKSSRLFYDFIHFTNAGAQEVARIIAGSLCPWLARRFPGHVSGPCASPGP
jgi:hypothetical protein